MLQAMLSGVASIKAQQTRMNVIGNNLANVNTTGFKGSRVTFQDMMAQTIRGAQAPNASLGGRSPVQYGLGVLVAGTAVNNEQGSLSATNRPTDFAIQGSGLFMVSNSGRVAYTRDGAFELDAEGFLVHQATGERLLGWTANPSTGEIDTNAEITFGNYLQLPLGSRAAAQNSTKIEWAGNLNSSMEMTDPPREARVRVYDSLGSAHELTLKLSKTDDGSGGWVENSWDWTVEDSDGNVLAKSGDTSATGPLTFDPANGGFVMPTDAAGNSLLPSITVPAAGTGAAAFDVQLDFSTFTQLDQASTVIAKSQNGFPPGSLEGFSVSPDGVITGLFTNGLTRNLGQVATAVFANPNGMDRIGSNLWRETNNSGVPSVGSPKTGGRGQITAGYLEQSNVDIGTEFTDLIITQRGFQSNTRVVTTVDEMLQDIINMKR